MREIQSVKNVLNNTKIILKLKCGPWLDWHGWFYIIFIIISTLILKEERGED